MASNPTRKATKVTKGEKSANDLTKINEQFDILLLMCKELKQGQEEIKFNQNKMQIQINEIEIKVNSVEGNNNLEETLDSKFQNIENKFNSQNNYIKEKILTYSDILKANKKKSEQTEKAITSINKGIENIKIKIGDEEEDEKKRLEQKADNICIFHVPESESSDLNTAKKDDEIKLKKVIGPKCEIKNHHVVFIKRIGEKVDNKCRPIIMKISDPNKRQELLNLKNLNYEQENIKTKIFVAPDRTKKQQEEHRELVKKLRQLREEGHTNNYIKNGRIIKYIQESYINTKVDWESCDQQ